MSESSLQILRQIPIGAEPLEKPTKTGTSKLRIFGVGCLVIILGIVILGGIAFVTGVFAGSKGNDDLNPSWSPDRSQIAFTSNRGGNKDIYVMNADGSNLRQLTADPLAWFYIRNNPVDKQLVWSPDGKSLAFGSGRDNNHFTRVNNSIFVMKADGSGVVRLTDPFSDADVPAWSPDGSRIAFTSNRDGSWNIYVMNKDGSNLTRLTWDDQPSIMPDWSPDGNRIAFVSGDNYVWQIFVMDSDGSNLRLIAKRLFVNASPLAWSPDGKLIAYTDQENAHSHIYVTDPNGTETKQITSGNYDDDDLDWSPDGAHLVFHSNRDGDWDIYAISLDGSNIVQLTGR